MDETYIKLKGKWVYLYRAVDKEGQTVDFMLSEKLDQPAARAFFNKAGINTINFALALLMQTSLSIYNKVA